ncbi:MAG: ubiquinone biosynthesis protein UbiH, partial [Ottowia sp.]|nr:ubiquinone biosynthesis protein UbiH [Ottowia sp.]
MPASHDVCIRGAGIVGRSLALLLARERLRVALVAPPPADAPRPADVRAYALSPAARTLLESLRCWPDERAATPVLDMQVFGDQGSQVRFSAAEQGVPALNWIVDVPALEQRLAEAVRYQSGIELLDAPVAAPLTVVCEGRASRT